MRQQSANFGQWRPQLGFPFSGRSMRMSRAIATTCLRRIHRRVDPGYVPNAQWIKQPRLGVSVCANSDGLLDDLAQHKNTAGAVTEKTAEWGGP
jgi:hypothetical protein